MHIKTAATFFSLSAVVVFDRGKTIDISE